jgi:hypothetical protein
VGDLRLEPIFHRAFVRAVFTETEGDHCGAHPGELPVVAAGEDRPVGPANCSHEGTVGPEPLQGGYGEEACHLARLVAAHAVSHDEQPLIPARTGE